MPKVSVIIPTYNRGDILADTIRMASVQDYPDYEVIVVDQDSVIPDTVQQAISDAEPYIRLIQLPQPNLPAARNAGVQASAGDIIIFIDDDVSIGPDYIALHARHYANSAVGGVTGLTLPSRPMPESDAIKDALGRFQAGAPSADGTAEVSWIVGCNGSYRKSALIKAGMSDERFTGCAWSEDADLAVRVRHTGYKLLFDPAIRLTHLELPSGGCENRTTISNEERRMEDRCRMHLFFYFKNCAFFGVRGIADGLWKAYRQFAFNRGLLTTPSTLPRRQTLFLRSIAGALKMMRAAARTADI